MQSVLPVASTIRMLGNVSHHLRDAVASVLISTGLRCCLRLKYAVNYKALSPYKAFRCPSKNDATQNKHDHRHLHFRHMVVSYIIDLWRIHTKIVRKIDLHIECNIGCFGPDFRTNAPKSASKVLRKCSESASKVLPNPLSCFETASKALRSTFISHIGACRSVSMT
jgi:hypothetical protein